MDRDILVTLDETAISPSELQEAAQAILSAQTDSFEEVKNKTWYKKLTNALTFHRQDKKLVLKNIRNLANLQSIFIQIYTQQLKEQSSELDGIVKSVLATQENVCALYYRIRGIEKQELTLPDSDKDILPLFLELIDTPDANFKKMLQAYKRNILRALGIQPAAGNLTEELLDNIQQADVFYRCALEAWAIANWDDFEILTFSDELVRAFDCLSTSPKARKSLYQSVKHEIDSYGLEYLTGKYLSSIPEYDGILLEENDCDTNTMPAEAAASTSVPTKVKNLSVIEVLDISEYEEITLSSIVHIPAGEQLTYRNKIIHLQTLINCEGQLVFDSCVLHYGEIESADEIKLSKTASLSMQQCTIENHSYDDRVFIDATAVTAEIRFDNCEFINCSNFLHTDRSDLVISHCRTINAGENFASGMNKTSIFDSEFLFCNEAPPNKKGGRYVLQSKRLEMSECFVKGTQQITATGQLGESFNQAQTIFEAEQGYANCSTFYGINALFTLGSSFSEFKFIVRQSAFLHCSDIFKTYGAAKIEDCRFDCCTSIGQEMHANSEIFSCQFNACVRNLFSTHYDGNVKLAYCEFNNWRATDASEQTSACENMLEFTRTHDKDSRCSEVKNCIFRGIVANQRFLISGRIFEKVSGDVLTLKSCDFINCTTKRESKKIIKEYAEYYKRDWKRELKTIQVKVVKIESNCRGLDRTNTSSGVVENVSHKTQTSTGQPIGKSTDPGTFGVLGYTPLQ